jgi:DNA helicase II / ATP-dependent DNA helicase PcrA
MSTDKKPIQYSAQQKALFNWIDNGVGSAFLQARAGCGKTTTLVGACARMTGHVALAAYNKKIADEINVKLKEAGVSNNSVRASTFHSVG